MGSTRGIAEVHSGDASSSLAASTALGVSSSEDAQQPG